MSPNRSFVRLFVSLAMFVILASASLSVAAEKAKDSSSSLQDRAAGLSESLGERAAFGVSVIDLASGKNLITIDADVPRIPASNQKLVSGALAMAVLGGDYKFTTNVYLSGKDIVVVGDFDPLLGDPELAEANKASIYDELDKWAAAIKSKVGAKFDGNILLVDTIGVPKRHGDWPKDQLNRWYAAPVGPLNFNNNCFDVTFVSGKSGVVPVVSPDSQFIDVRNHITAGKGGVWSLKASDEDSVVTLTGTAGGPNSTPASVAMNNPTMVLGRVLADRLVKAGVEITGGVGAIAEKDFDKPAATLLASSQTPLSAVLPRANKHSLNMVAECMFLRSCGSWADGPARAGEVLTKTYGLPAESFHIADGGGLSKNNRIAPSSMTKILRVLAQRKDAQIFFDSLPIGGVDGTMEKRLTDARYKGRVLAKTGYVTGVSCLSGYILDADSKPVIAFSVMVNNISGPGDAKQFEDNICKLLVDSLKK